MENSKYHTPTRLIFGKGIINRLPEVMRPIGNKVLLAHGGGSIKRLGPYDKVKELLKDFEIHELGGIEPNPNTIRAYSTDREYARRNRLMLSYVQLISNNHDPENRHVITCKPVHICRKVWIGAGAPSCPELPSVRMLWSEPAVLSRTMWSQIPLSRAIPPNLFVR